MTTINKRREKTRGQVYILHFMEYVDLIII